MAFPATTRVDVKFYTNSKQYGNNVLVRGIENGERFIEKFPFQPTLYSRVNRETGFKSLEGEHLLPKVFDDINAAKDFVKKYREVDNFPIFGNTAYQFQWISDNYKGEVEYDLDQIKVMSIDIETTVNYGFPDYFDPKEEITLITCRDKVTKKITTFGCWEYMPKKQGVTYVKCRDEVDLLCKFINFFAKDHPDIITGWNTDGFDIPYLVCRCRKIVGEDITKKLSPFGVIKHRDVEIKGKMIQEYEIYGIASLDYLALFRKFAFMKFENEKLDTVAFHVLGRNKVENPYNSFREFYEKDPDLFTDYNIVDVELVDDLEGKLKLIELAISIAYMAKINFDDVYSPVKMWDTIIYNHLLDQGIVVPFKKETVGKNIEGAFVKEVQIGKHGYIASFDLASLYPHIIMALNMSPETIVNRMIDVSVNELLSGDRSKVQPGYSLAPNGSMYDMSKVGFLPVLMSKYYGGRKTVKNEMLELKKELEAKRHEMTAEQIRQLENKITAKHNLQLALKIAINSAYGALAQSSFRFFDTRIAEGITMSGQLIIRTAEKTINDFLNGLLKNSKAVDYVIASDTDSLYVELSQFVNTIAPGKTLDETVEFLCKVCDGRLSKVLNGGCDDLATTMNWNLGKIVFKREAIASTGIWVGKKMYALIVHDNEGVRYEEPDLKVMGLALVRSSTPDIVKDPLRKCIEVILTGDEQTLHQYVREVEDMYMKQPHEVIAFPRGVNNIAKYRSNSTIYVKGCPIQVRATLLYNHLLNEHGLNDREPIQEGGKLKYVYLKEPNTLHENVIGFTDKIPAEFNLIRYVDYNTMFEKSFIEPLKKLTTPIGWSHKEVATLEGLFE